jgi:hypothetical protein
MKNSVQDKETLSKKTAFEYFLEIIGWLQITASPLLIGLLTGAVIYFLNPNLLTLIIGSIITATGFIIGIIWATRVWRKHGTMHFLSRIMATPELDKNDEEQIQQANNKND